MLAILSPAKTLDFDSRPSVAARTQPRLMDGTAKLAERLAELTPRQIGDLMSINESLAELNHGRYADFEVPHPALGTMPAIYAFRGDVYRGLDADRWTTKQVEYADSHLRILSGLYGLLRPLDSMLPYRLEMGTSLDVDGSKNLYEFWGNRITDLLVEDLRNSKSNILLNLASNEYFKSIDAAALDCNVIAPAFKEVRDGKPKMITVYAKVARGTLASWVIRNRVKTLAKLKKFDEDGYRFSEEHSTEQVPVFLRDGDRKA